MIISVSGLGFSGSGAVLDLLKEYDGFIIKRDFEYSFLYYPDGIIDLDYHINQVPIRYMSSDAAIYRFSKMMLKKNKHKCLRQTKIQKERCLLTHNYIKKISDVSWKGNWGFYDYDKNWLKNFLDNQILNRLHILYGKIFKKCLYIYPNREMHLSIKNSNFELETQKYIEELLGIKDNKLSYVFDQLFPGDNPTLGYKYFDCDCKTIVVRRDPRDLYILAKKIVTAYATWIPTKNVDSFITYYRKIFDSDNGSNNVLYIQYEDMIYQYKTTKEKIEAFLKVSNGKSETYFKPNYSIRYTQLYKKYDMYVEDIKKIEAKLSDYCYAFPYENKDNPLKGKVII